MTVEELTSQILALPPDKRAALAQTVWKSLEDSQVNILPEAEADALALARRRDEEMESGAVVERDHKKVIEHARRSVKCE